MTRKFIKSCNFLFSFWRTCCKRLLRITVNLRNHQYVITCSDLQLQVCIKKRLCLIREKRKVFLFKIFRTCEKYERHRDCCWKLTKIMSMQNLWESFNDLLTLKTDLYFVSVFFLTSNKLCRVLLQIILPVASLQSYALFHRLQKCLQDVSPN